MDQKVVAVIPARLGSTRFPRKVLAKLCGKPVLEHVYQQVRQSKQVHEVVVATGDQEVVDLVEGFGGRVIKTKPDHATGTDRIVEAVQSIQCDWVLNVQGDEPLINPQDLDKLIMVTQYRETAEVATLVYPFENEAEAQDPNNVKVVLNLNQEALYFSRSLIPYQKERHTPVYKHLGVYLYQKSFLQQFNQWNRSPLEETEQLEQLRILEKGYSILCVQADYEGVGIDQPEDLEKAEMLLKALQGD